MVVENNKQKEKSTSASSAKKRKRRFKKDQSVVYPSQGIGVVRSIEKIMFNEVLTEYYVLYIESSSMTIKIPVNRAEELGLRPIVSKGEAEQALSVLEQEQKPLNGDWKQRYQTNLSLLKDGGINAIANIVHALYHRKLVKELPVFERKLYDGALQLLIEEVSLACNINKEETEQRIMILLNTQAAAFKEREKLDLDDILIEKQNIPAESNEESPFIEEGSE